MTYREITTLEKQFKVEVNWPRFIKKIKIKGLRGWTDTSVDFQFPVVAIVGENGTGKSTLLKALACAYQNKKKEKTFNPSDFFIETQWEKIQNVKIDYEIKFGNKREDVSISKKKTRWNINKGKKRPENNVYLLEISRTLPLDATAGYAKMAKVSVKEISRSEINEEYRERLSYILGRDYKNASFVTTELDTKKEVGLLTREVGEISQYHQGAGEDATLDLIRLLQDLPNYSLLIIDEIEASLHPKSQRRIIQFLIWFCRQKKCQIVLSTHSPYILQELPEEARIMLLPGEKGINVITGVTSEFAMTKLDEVDYPELELIVEDTDTEIWLREIIAFLDNDDMILPRVRISNVGPANVVQIFGKIGAEKRLPYKILAILDGDQNPTIGCLNMPGEYAPEYVIFQDLQKKNWANLSERFGIGAGTLHQILDDAMRNPDQHQWTTIIGNRIKKGTKSVWEIMCSEWCKNCLIDTEIQKFKNSIEQKLEEKLNEK